MQLFFWLGIFVSIVAFSCWGPALAGCDFGCLSFLLGLYLSLRPGCYFLVGLASFFNSSFFFSSLFGLLRLFRLFNPLFGLEVGFFLCLRSLFISLIVSRIKTHL